MTEWFSKEEKQRLLGFIKSQSPVGRAVTEDVLRAKMELEAIEVATRAANASERAANASERNAKIMLWATGFAAVSAVASLLAVIVPLFIKH
jgi:hypothetical protein